MSDALFLPRELFSPASATRAAVQPAVRVQRGVHFASGEAVAADLLKGLTPMDLLPQLPTERRRRPRPGPTL
jgi:hypothetical protein